MLRAICDLNLSDVKAWSRRAASAFVKRIRGFDGGRERRAFKDQLSRLSVAVVRLATTRGDRAFQVNAQIVEKVVF